MFLKRINILALSIVMVLTGCATTTPPEVIVPEQTIIVQVDITVPEEIVAPVDVIVQVESSSPVEETASLRNAEDYPTTQDIPGVTATHGVVVTERLVGLEIPSYIENHPVVAKLGYALSYNIDYVQPDWVAYVLTKEEVESESVGRSDKFYEETDVIQGSALLSDYKKSGYDRGHLLSSANRNFSEDFNQSTFSLLNMSPQLHRFNAGLFLKAEKAEREVAVEYEIAFIVSGPIFFDEMETIGASEIAVPEEFYKVFLVQDEDDEWHAIGLILPQEYENGNLSIYAVTVDTVEEITGIDFYPSLDDEIEIVVEAEMDRVWWPW